MMDSLHDALLNRAKRQGLETTLTAAMVVESANRVLPTICKAKQIKNGVLTIYAKSAADSYACKQEADSYIELINAALPSPMVKEIIVRIQH